MAFGHSVIVYWTAIAIQAAANMVFTLGPSAHLPALATRAGLGTISGSSGIVRFV